MFEHHGERSREGRHFACLFVCLVVLSALEEEEEMIDLYITCGV